MKCVETACFPVQLPMNIPADFPPWMLMQYLAELLMIHFLKHTHYTKGDYILASFTDYKNLIHPNETATKKAFSFSLSIFWQFPSCAIMILSPHSFSYYQCFFLISTWWCVAGTAKSVNLLNSAIVIAWCVLRRSVLISYRMYCVHANRKRKILEREGEIL